VKAFLFSRKALAALLLLAVGVAKVPLEEKFSNDLRAQNLREAPMDLDMMEGLGQMAVAAGLGGLRSLVANIFYLSAYSAYEDLQWTDVDTLMKIATRLEPHNPSYWEEASWHMAYNAADYYLNNKSLRPALQATAYKDKVARGIEILQQGLHYLPNDPRLLMKLGQTYADRAGEPPVVRPQHGPLAPNTTTGDPRKAAEAFLACYEHGGPDYAERFAAYQMAKLSDRASWEKAYEILKRYYDKGMRAKNTTIMTLLPKLEELLNIPLDKRVVPLPHDVLPTYKPPQSQATAPK